MSRRLASFLIAVLTFAPLATSAQTPAQGGSVLWLIPPAGRLELDRVVNGALSASDYFGPDETYLDVWELEGRAGTTVTIELKSSDFDAMLFVVAPGLVETLMDDDGAGRCDARITLRVLEDGAIRVAATLTESRTTGLYTLLATTNPAPPSSVTCGGPDPDVFARLPVTGQVNVGGAPVQSGLDNADPLLDNGAYAEVWELSGSAGETLRIRMESAALDAYLYLMGPGINGVLVDDDSGGDLDAEIVVTLTAAGTFRVIASTAGGESMGAYRLSVSRQEGLAAR